MSLLFDPKTAGLLVIDVQERLWPYIDSKAEVLHRIIQAIRVAGRLRIPILATEQYVKGLGSTIKDVRELLDTFNAYHPIEKMTFSCLGESNVVDAVKKLNLETLFLVGIEAHVCVLQTALEALDSGFRVFYIAEATSSRDPRHKEEAISRVRQAGGVICSVEMFAFEAMRTSEHPNFKKVQRVIV